MTTVKTSHFYFMFDECSLIAYKIRPHWIIASQQKSILRKIISYLLHRTRTHQFI